MSASRSIILAMLTAVAAMPGVAIAATADSGQFDVSVGAEFSSGEYGGDRTVEDLYVPVTGRYRTDGYSLRLTVPYLRVDAPEGTIIEGPGGQPIPGDGPDTTESGLGDVVLGLTVFDIWNAADGSMALDLGGRVKFGTADEAKGLGTGETDFTVQADVLKFMPGFTAIASAGYVVRGDPEDFDLDNGFLAALGAMTDATPRLRLGAFLEYQQASYRFNDDLAEVVGVVSWPMRSWQAQLHATAGLSDSAPDWAVGFTVFPRR